MERCFDHAIATWRSGVRGRSFHAVFVFGVLMLIAAWLAASFSARQPQAVALDVGLSGVRLSLTLLSLVWVQDLVGKEIDRRTVFFVLAYPAPRACYLLGRYLGIVLLELAALLLLGLILLAVIQFSTWGYQYPHGLQLGWPYWATLAAMALDLAVVTAFALCVATFATSSILPLAMGGGFALASRMLGPVLDFLSRGADGDPQFADRFNPIMQTIKWLIPDLSRLDIRAWPLYGTSPDLVSLVLTAMMAVGYITIGLLVGAAAFRHREFS